MNDIFSFYQLISKYQIEIPIIQRDYAQGRDNMKAADVRKSLVEKMKIAVEDEDKTLFFDFVYGRVDANKFIPFDGQQRLTSLFLFHKYVFEKCQSESDCRYNGKCLCKEILKRFSYATRQSSREFCEKLVQENVIPSDDKKVSENIENLSWFYPDWKKDPTIIGMLTMLDEIHNQMNGKKNFKVFAEKLTSGCNCPITFHFVDMGEHKLSDETYVKMNARGKQLTPFENFKASLEQYLEEKNEQELLSRLKGKYDESKQKYTGIDGSWLDLFWEVTNKEKQENDGKELPDSLMMSFFNRHFMNVWRCWYENNSMTEKERKSLSEERKNEQKKWDDFNSRIKNEMPFYPSKEDFVSFEIYSFVMNNCSADKCLTPIFNICDTLYAKEDNIKKDCQAVWNRGEELWNLYQGNKNNDNRETYPSRVAFYSLMKYFESNADTSQLDQWMRIAWNIIENSTIDSEDTYHAALKLINELSEHSHDIYQYLSNPDANIKSKHAEDQVKEEIAKAKQILNGSPRNDGKSWENIIIEAEKYKFFKGAIRFLFTKQKIGDNWEHFDTKWGNAKMFFDENGVKDCEVKKYRTEAILLKAVLYHVKDFWKYIEPQKFVLDNAASTWKKNILLEKGWEKAVHKVLMGELDVPERNEDCLMYRNLYKTDLLNYVANEQVGSRIRWHHGHRTVYPPRYDGIMLDDENRDKPFYRNSILSSLPNITSSQRIRDKDFYKGWDINFNYSKNGYFYAFQWNTDEHVYLIENNERKKKADGTDYCVSVESIKDSEGFLQKLDNLINQVRQNEQ